MKQTLRMILCLFTLLGWQFVQAQTRQVTGKVSDATGAPLPGVSVTVKGKTQGGITDVSGKYTVSVPNNATLVFSYIGYKPQEMAVGSQSKIDISLEDDAAALSDLVVVGYGTQRKSQLTGAISSITSQQINELPVTNLGQAMQGRVAGVDITQSGSNPSSSPTIVIRGHRSINATNEPLYVVDGIPLANGYGDLNPNDVQSLEVLKDATATAIYGARGANGVVIITTKRGPVNGKTTVSYDMYVGVNDALDKAHFFNGPEYAEYKREANRAVGKYTDASGVAVPTGTVNAAADAKIFEAVELDGIANNRTTDYQSMLARRGFTQNHSIGIQGGNEKTQFYISTGYYQNTGIAAGLDYNRYTLRANIDHQISKVFKVGLSSYSMYSLSDGANRTIFDSNLYRQNPLGKAYDANGNLIFAPTNDALLSNPMAEIVPGAQVDQTKKYRILNNIYVEAKILNGLKYRVSFSPDFTNTRIGRFIGSQTNYNKGGSPVAIDSSKFQFNWTVENILSYSKTINGVHNFDVTLLQSIQRDNFESSFISVLGVPVESQQFYNVGNASTVTGVGSNLIQWTINSYMGRLNYGYKDKYMVTATLRRDGSSVFGDNNKYGNFPGVAVAWNLNSEKFLKNVSWLDQLKLRASYGSVGNQGVSPYQTQGLLGRTAYAWNNTAAFGYGPNTIGNPNLKWETSTTANLGVDFSFWRGRLSGSLELYTTNTTDLLLKDQLPTSTGFSSVIRNIGETNNKGLELFLSSVNMDRGGFKWTTDFTFMKNKESIISLYNGPIDDLGNLWFIGQPIQSWFDYKKLGIWQTSEADQAKALQSSVGQIKIQDTNGDGKITAADRVLIGNSIPSYSGSIINRFKYKGFDLSFQIYARIGQIVKNNFLASEVTNAGRYNELKVNYWTPTNPTNDFPQPNLSQEFPVYNTSFIYVDGSFVKMRNINFGYTFTNKLASRLGMQSLRIYTSINQPFIWSAIRSKYGVDPETSNGVISDTVTPAVRTTTIGLNVKF